MSVYTDLLQEQKCSYTISGTKCCFWRHPVYINLYISPSVILGAWKFDPMYNVGPSSRNWGTMIHGNDFPYITFMSLFLENFQNYIS